MLHRPINNRPQAGSLPRIAASRKRCPLIIPWRRITLSVSEGTVLPEPRPLAYAQGYPEYLYENRRGAQIVIQDLEIQSHAYLDITRRVVRIRRANPCEVGAQHIRIRIGQHRDVERIVRLGPQLQIDPLADSEDLVQGHIVCEKA